MLKPFDNGIFIILKFRDREVYHVYRRMGEALVLVRAGLYTFEDALEEVVP
jgi:hypothetical protein